MKKPEKPGLNEEDHRLWQLVASRVRPYAKSSRSPKKETRPAAKTVSAAGKEKQALPPPAPVLPRGVGFDSATRRKFERGKLDLEGRLDLHGMTQAAAFDALCAFIQSAATRGRRTVLVITGKGRLQGGVLRRQLPLWLEGPSLAPYVLAVSPAQPKDGGTGAVYIRLRKKK